MPVNLEIVTPERLLLSRAVDMVVIPASEGDMGVLEGHAPAIVMLRGGIIAIYDGEQVTDQMYVAGGFAEVTPERCTVLASEVLAAVDLSRERANGVWRRPMPTMRLLRRRTSSPRSWRWNASSRRGRWSRRWTRC